MFAGAFKVKRGNCVIGDHKVDKKYVFEFNTSRETGEDVGTYSLEETNADNAACWECWRKIGLYIVSETSRVYKPRLRREQFLEILRDKKGEVVRNDVLAKSLYGMKDNLGLDKVRKMVEGLRHNGFDIETVWGVGYKLVNDPEVGVY
jgi:biotin operon repressor